jgi:hypothetical protein
VMTHEKRIYPTKVPAPVYSRPYCAPPHRSTPLYSTLL